MLAVSNKMQIRSVISTEGRKRSIGCTACEPFAIIWNLRPRFRQWFLQIILFLHQRFHVLFVCLNIMLGLQLCLGNLAGQLYWKNKWWNGQMMVSTRTNTECDIIWEWPWILKSLLEYDPERACTFNCAFDIEFFVGDCISNRVKESFAICKFFSTVVCAHHIWHLFHETGAFLALLDDVALRHDIFCHFGSILVWTNKRLPRYIRKNVFFLFFFFFFFWIYLGTLESTHFHSPSVL